MSIYNNIPPLSPTMPDGQEPTVEDYLDQSRKVIEWAYCHLPHVRRVQGVAHHFRLSKKDELTLMSAALIAAWVEAQNGWHDLAQRTSYPSAFFVSSPPPSKSWFVRFRIWLDENF